MTSLTVTPASRYGSVALARLATRTFEGYALPVRMDAGSLEAFNRERDVDPALSPVLLAGGTPVGLALLAKRGDTGYVAEIGVLPEARGRGVGRALLDAALTRLADAGARRCVLEVLAGNVTAERLYADAGFAATRRLPCYRTRALVGRNLDVTEVPVTKLRGDVPADLPWGSAWRSAVNVQARGYVHASGGFAVAKPAPAGLVVYHVGGADAGAVVDGLAALHAGRPATYQNVADVRVAEALERRGWERYATQVEMTRAL